MRSQVHKKRIVHILYPNRWDVDSWSKKNEQGLEPDKYQYGFNRLEKYGFKVTYCRFPQNYLLKQIGRLISKLMPFHLDLYAIIFHLKHFQNADIFINPLDNEGFTLCWLRKYNFFGLRKKIHIFIAPWLPSYVLTCSERKLNKYKALLSTVDMCLYYSTNEKKVLEEYLNIPKEKLEKLRFGVDADFYIPESVQEENFILAPGNDSFRDFEILCDVFKSLPNETLYIASKMRIKNREFPPNIHYLDLQYNRELLDYYRRATIILIPIKKGCHTSSGTTVLMESMLLGKPVIASATDYIKETVDDKEMTVLVEPNKPLAIIDAIKCLNSNHALRQKLGGLARAEAIKCFTSENCMQELTESIHHLLSQVKKLTVHVILPYNFWIHEWVGNNVKGLLPGCMHYDLLKLNDYGLNVTYRDSSLNSLTRLLSRISRFLMGFSLIHYICQIRLARTADLIMTRLDPEGIAVCVTRKLKLFGFHKKPHVYKVSWLPHYLANTKGFGSRFLISCLETVDLFLVGTPSIKANIQKYLDLPDSRFSFNAHGIDCDFFTPTQMPPDSFILCVGNDSHRDFKILNEILKRLNGPTKVILASEIKSKITGIQESERLQIVHLSHTELRDHYNRARFIIIPIKKGCVTDSGITTLKEAMCMGKAVVASATDAMKELVENGINGLVVEPGNVDQMVERINYLLENPTVCNTLGQEALKKREEFSTKTQLKNLAVDIKSLIAPETSL